MHLDLVGHLFLGVCFLLWDRLVLDLVFVLFGASHKVKVVNYLKVYKGVTVGLRVCWSFLRCYPSHVMTTSVQEKISP